MKKEFEITPQNYEGYCELYALLPSSYNSYIKRLFIIALVGLTSILVGITLNLNLMVIIGFLTSITSPATMIYTSKNIKEITENYPNVDVNINHHSLKNALIKAKILKFNKKKEEIDIDSYLEKIRKEKILEEMRKKAIEDIKIYKEKCEEIKNDIINERTYEIAEEDISVSDSELKKVRQKIKVLIQK